MAVKTPDVAHPKSGAFLIEPDAQYHSATPQNLQAFIPASQIDYGEIEDRDVASVALTNHRLQHQNFTVGRPSNGILAKPNTHAFVQVLGPTGQVVNCFNNIGRNNRGEDADSLLASSGYYLSDRNKFDPADSDAGDVIGAQLAGAWEDMKSMVGLGDDGGDPAVSPGSAKAPIWTDWILQSVNESRVEKTQVVETFGDSYFYVFGERPRSISFSGVLMNTTDYNWRSIFWKNWDEYFRATKLVESGNTLYIQWDDIIVAGYPVNAMCNEVADSPNALRFSFNLFVTDYLNVSAQNGFLTQRYMRIAQLRSGSGLGTVDPVRGYQLIGGEGFDPRAFNYRRTDLGLFNAEGGFLGLEGALNLRNYDGAQFQKFSIMESVVDSGALGNQVKRGLGALGALGPGDEDTWSNSRTGMAIMRSAGFAASALMKMKILGNQNDNGSNGIYQKQLLNSMLRTLSVDMAVAVGQDVSNLAEDALGVRRGEINRFMGYFSTLPLTDDIRDANNEVGVTDNFSSVESMVKSWINSSLFNGGDAFGGRYQGADGVYRTAGTLPGGITMVSNEGTVIGTVDDELVYEARPSATPEEG